MTPAARIKAIDKLSKHYFSWYKDEEYKKNDFDKVLKHINDFEHNISVLNEVVQMVQHQYKTLDDEKDSFLKETLNSFIKEAHWMQKKNDNFFGELKGIMTRRSKIKLLRLKLSRKTLAELLNQYTREGEKITPEQTQDGTKKTKPPIPFPRRLKKEKEKEQFQKFLGNLQQLHINIPFIEALEQMPKYAKFMKDLLSKKGKGGEASKITLNKQCSAVVLNRVPPKERDPGAKVDVSASLPYPTNVKGIQSFLGHAGFYRRFIKDFSKIALPMTQLLIKDAKFDFSDECIKSFNILWDKLITAPMIIAPNWDIDFELMCDANDYAVGAVLGQRIEIKFRPIYYASKTMNNAQEHYTTTEKELLAVEFTIEIKDKNRSENLAADHISRLENPGLEELNEDTIQDNFPDEHLMVIKLKDTETDPWYADYANFLVSKIVPQHLTYYLRKENFERRKHRFLQLNQLDEFRTDAYEYSRAYKERTKRWHDSKIIDKKFQEGEEGGDMEVYGGRIGDVEILTFHGIRVLEAYDNGLLTRAVFDITFAKDRIDIENMLIRVAKFTFLSDFVILKMEEDSGTERMIFHIDSAMKHSYSNDDTCFSINVIDEILEEDFDALLDEDEFMAITPDENSKSKSDTEEQPFEKIIFNIDYKIKTSLEEPPTDLKLKPLHDNLEYAFLEEPSFLLVIISS
ncbi:reverse transcriptase domain-containing protein [Tanacetum coccineum]